MPQLKNTPDKDIAKRLKALREQKELTLIDVAEKLDPYVNINLIGNGGRSVISNLENQKQNLTIELAVAYSKVFNVSLEYILCQSDDMQPQNKTIKVVLGLSDRAIEAIKNIKEDISPIDELGYVPPNTEILDALLRAGFISKLLKSFGGFIYSGILHNDNSVWLGHPGENAMRPSIWYLKNEIDDAVEAVIDTFVSKFSNQQ